MKLEFDKKFGAILCDPPWSFNDKGSRAAPDCKDHFDYDTLIVEQILDLQVKDIAREKSHLYLWVPAAFKEAGYQVVREWGFTPKLEIVWVKVSAAGCRRLSDKIGENYIDGNFMSQNGELTVADKNASAKALHIDLNSEGIVKIGMGHYYRHAHESCIFGVRGKLRCKTNNTPTVFFAPVGKHSAKPSHMRTLIEENSPGPYLEMFARGERPFGWHTWGLEAEE